MTSMTFCSSASSALRLTPSRTALSAQSALRPRSFAKAANIGDGIVNYFALHGGAGQFASVRYRVASSSSAPDSDPDSLSFWEFRRGAEGCGRLYCHRRFEPESPRRGSWPGAIAAIWLA